MKTLNKAQLDNLFTQLSAVILNENQNATYCADETPQIGIVAQDTVKHYGLAGDEGLLEQMLVYRESVEKKLAKKYKINFDCFDLTQAYKAKKVPKSVQVRSGLLDTMIGNMVLSCDSELRKQLTASY